MNSDLQLDSLLNALRAAGLRVGISEILRLQQVFAHQPGLGGGSIHLERLRSLLRAVLIKSVEDRSIFDRIFDAWLDRADEELVLRQSQSEEEFIRLLKRDIETAESSRASHLPLATMALALMVLLVVMIVDVRILVHSSKTLETVAQPQIVPEPTTLGPQKTPPADKPGALPPRAALPEAGTSRWRFLPWPEIGLAALAWSGAGGFWLVLRRRRLLPEPEPLTPAAGPPRAFPLSTTPMGKVLLASFDQESVAWGIGRFVSEEPTRRLDLAATVRATAQAGGVPEMRFHRARFYREVWLWVDEDADDPALSRLAEELEAVLAAHGLPVERAMFRGVPYRLVTMAKQAFAPNEIDERRDAALVAVLTDGRRLVRRWTDDSQRVRIDSLLRSLAQWPHLAFVGNSSERDGLGAILSRHGIAVIAPVRVAAFLGGAAPPRDIARPASSPNMRGEVAWAAVCALCPSPVDEVTALELRRRLQLTSSPYSLQTLRAEAPGPPGRLDWRPADRIRHVSWLREAEDHPTGAVIPGSLLGRALDFWEEIYDRSLAEHSEHTETAADRFLLMGRALLSLWRKPGKHIAELYRLYQGPLRETIKQHCSTLAPADWGGKGLIHLPWSWQDRTSVERAMLREMCFGGGMPPATLRRPGRAWLGIGLLVGLGLTAAAVAAFGCRNSQVEENGLTFVRICPGTFIMGSKANDLQADGDEKPAHQVTLSEFWMSKFEVTNEQYRKLEPERKGESGLPVTGVTWVGARDFCLRFGYRLPTEAEWEYAARAGTETPWSSGSEVGALGRFAWFEQGFDTYVHPVGLKEPNPWGLHDMHGNVWEWVRDVYVFYPSGPQVNPRGPRSGQLRVLRGGSFLRPASDLRSTGRRGGRPELGYRDIGFRCVRDPRR